MFGYVNVNKPELKMKDFYKYKAYYCGLCKTLKDRFGRFGQLTLSYDMTFLVILLTSLYESSTKQEKKRCMVHPVKSHAVLRNEITEYVADMNIVLTYHHLMDDWQDEKSLAGLAGSKVLRRAYKKISKSYPRQCDQIRESLNQLKELEEEYRVNMKAVVEVNKHINMLNEKQTENQAENQTENQTENIAKNQIENQTENLAEKQKDKQIDYQTDNEAMNEATNEATNEADKVINEDAELDFVSRCFGELMAALFVYKEDVWKNSLKKIGFYLGKYIYILDAYDDLQQDMKKCSYNPLIRVHANKSFEADIEQFLTMMMAECTEEFEKLPCLLDVDILRNILYSGVWMKYEKISKERNSAI